MSQSKSTYLGYTSKFGETDRVPSFGEVVAMDKAYRASSNSRRVGVVVLALFVLGYLVGITYWRLEELSSPRSLVVLAGLWTLGILALALLARAWPRS